MSWDDEDWPEDDDSEHYPVEPEESFTVVCSNCQAEVYEDADVCPRCGDFIVPNTHPLTGRPLWFVAMGITGIIAVILTLSGLLFLL